MGESREVNGEKGRIDLLVIHATVVTMDGQRRIIEDGAVAIQGDTIVAVGKTEELLQKYKAQRVIDCEGNIVLPGLIDSHVHVCQTFARGICDLDHPELRRIIPAEDTMGGGPQWAVRAWLVDSGLSAEEAYYSTLLAALEMVKAGTTTFADTCVYQPEEVARAVGEIGMRAVLGKNTTDIADLGHTIPETMLRPREEEVAASVRFIEEWNGAYGGRIRTWFGLHALWACSDELCRSAREVASKYNTGIAMHISQTDGEITYSLQRRGRKRPIAHADELGLLGPDFVAVHSTHMTRQEAELYKDREVKIAHCPTAAMK